MANRGKRVFDIQAGISRSNQLGNQIPIEGFPYLHPQVFDGVGLDDATYSITDAATGLTQVRDSDYVVAIDGINVKLKYANPSGAFTDGRTFTTDNGVTFVMVSKDTVNKIFTISTVSDDALLLEAVSFTEAISGRTGSIVNLYDSFLWTVNGAGGEADVVITGAAQTLEKGLLITFASTEGHTIDDEWDETITTPYISIVNANGTEVAKIYGDGEYDQL